MSTPGAEGARPPASGLTRTVTIANKRGLHARAAAKFVKTAGQFDAQLWVAKHDTEVSGLSIMGLMMLAAGIGVAIQIRAEGPDAERALAAVVDLVLRKFDED